MIANMPDTAINKATQQDPYTLWELSIANNSVPDLQRCLALASRLLDSDEYARFREEVFHDVLGRGPTPLLALHMLDHEGIPVTLVTPNSIFQRASQALIEELIGRGWDINTSDPPAFARKRLLDYLVRERYGKEDLARWLVREKGAAVADVPWDPDDHVQVPPQPLLEACAAYGTVSMFVFLEEAGAKPGPRMLHLAVEVAAGEGADPFRREKLKPRDLETRDETRAEMLHYLVDKRRLDVNAMDATALPRSYSAAYCAATYWGTPICYAARWQKGASVVRWLLENGADPTIEGTYTGMDALACAKEAKCQETVSILDDWARNRRSFIE
ncbi:hypothetical protein F4808DRAFT_470481 [Astrocystis sublimbata]|nr:hypothetical protein F4808DRAFT_470481 [Astrocystis sublimbata]